MKNSIFKKLINDTKKEYAKCDLSESINFEKMYKKSLKHLFGVYHYSKAKKNRNILCNKLKKKGRRL